MFIIVLGKLHFSWLLEAVCDCVLGEGKRRGMCKERDRSEKGREKCHCSFIKVKVAAWAKVDREGQESNYLLALLITSSCCNSYERCIKREGLRIWRDKLVRWAVTSEISSGRIGLFLFPHFPLKGWSRSKKRFGELVTRRADSVRCFLMKKKMMLWDRKSIGSY